MTKEIPRRPSNIPLSRAPATELSFIIRYIMIDSLSPPIRINGLSHPPGLSHVLKLQVRNHWLICLGRFPNLRYACLLYTGICLKLTSGGWKSPNVWWNYWSTHLLRTPHDAPSGSAYACLRKDTQKKENMQLLSNPFNPFISCQLFIKLGCHTRTTDWITFWGSTISKSRLLDRVQFCSNSFPKLQAFSIDPIEPWTFPLHTP